MTNRKPETTPALALQPEEAFTEYRDLFRTNHRAGQRIATIKIMIAVGPRAAAERTIASRKDLLQLEVASFRMRQMMKATSAGVIIACLQLLIGVGHLVQRYLR